MPNTKSIAHFLLVDFGEGYSCCYLVVTGGEQSQLLLRPTKVQLGVQVRSRVWQYLIYDSWRKEFTFHSLYLLFQADKDKDGGVDLSEFGALWSAMKGEGEVGEIIDTDNDITDYV